MKVGDIVTDAFAPGSVRAKLVELTSECSISPAGYRVWEVENCESGKRFKASEYDLKVVEIGR